MALPPAHGAWPRHTIDNSSRGADGIRINDINKDGLPDLVTGWEEGGLVRVYVNPGPVASTNAWPAVTVGRVATPEDAVFADVDGDGQLDVVSSCEGKNKTVYVHWAPNNPEQLMDANQWRTEAFPATAGLEAWMFCLPLNVDGANGIDLVVGSKGENASISWLKSPETDRRDLSKWNLHCIYDATWIMSLIEQDMDGDGDADILLSDRKPPGSGVKWLEKPNDVNKRSQRWPAHLIGGEDEEVMFIELVVDHVANSMRVAAAVKPNQLVVWAPNEAGAAWSERGRHAVSDRAGGAKAVRIGDINLDGQLNVVFDCEAATDGKLGVVWLERTSDGTTVEHDISGHEGVKFDRIELLDLDADGDLDVITCEERDNLGVIWYENPTK